MGKDFVPFSQELIQCGVHVDRVPEHDEIDDEAKRTELVLPAFAITLTQLATFAMEVARASWWRPSPRFS
jgi:hypothetical protein